MDAELARIPRLRLHTVVVRRADDLTDLTPHPVAPEVATRAVHHLRRRGRLLLLCGALALVAAAVLATVVNARAEDLLRTGTRTPGVVVDTTGPFWAFAGSISVRYPAGGVDRVGRINLNGDNAPAPAGTRVTVIYDPADPDRIRTPDEANTAYWSTILVVIGLFCGMIAGPVGWIAAVRWGRRANAVRGHPWRAGSATVVGRSGESALLDVVLADGPAKVRTTGPVRWAVPKGLAHSDVLLGGTGRHLVVLFQTGPFLMAAKPRD